MPGIGDFLFGGGGEAPAPFRGPGFENQGDILNQLILGQLYKQNPQFFDLYGQKTGLHNRAQYRAIKEGFPLLGSPPSFTAGQDIPSAVPDLSSFGMTNRAPFQFNVPQDNFQYQLPNFNAQQAVGDAFTPQFDIAKRLIQRTGEEQRQGILEDLNARGLLTAGATTEQLGLQRRSEADQLANIASQLASQQGQAQLGAQQFGAQLGTTQQQLLQQQAAQQQQLQYQRQLDQAAEIFRQQGASDAQAQALAQNAIQRRQLSLGEFGAQQQAARQPIEDLLKLYAFSTGSNPGMPASPGLLQGLAQGAGMALPFLL